MNEQKNLAAMLPLDSTSTPVQHPDISVVIPVFKAADCLKELYRRLIQSLEALDVSFEIIMIEDCGGDDSWEIIRELSTLDKRLKGFKLSRNFGQHNALTAGLAQASGSWIVIMDCDLQDKPEDISRLIEKTQEGYEVVIARSIVRRKSWFKHIAANIFYGLFSWLSGYRYEDGVRSFRIMSCKSVDVLKAMPEQMRSIGPLGIWIGFSSTFIDIQLEERHSGKSSYGIRRLLRLALQNIVAFSDKPLRISIIIGFAMAGCAFAYGLYTFISALLHNVGVPGWTSLITSLYFIGGLILANLGVLGVYIGKTFEEAKGRPLYIISRSTLLKDSGAPLPLSPRAGR